MKTAEKKQAPPLKEPSPELSQKEKKRLKKKEKKEGRRIRSLEPMGQLTPFLMKKRNDACNFFEADFDTEAADIYITQKRKEGLKSFSMMHLLIAAYVRTVAEYPGVNRFIRGQRIYTRRNVEVALTIKKEMTLESPDTVVKVVYEPDATMEEVYEKLNAEIEGYRNAPGGDFDNVAGVLSYVPGILLKGIIGLLRGLDYFNLMPKFLHKVSPFHCSMFITSMGSLGIPPIYHHLYNFGSCPQFLAFGAKKREYKVRPDGSVYKDTTVGFTFAMDERICDGFYYASALKLYKAILKDPWQLDAPPAEVIEDIK